jgi:ABC-type polysaccharide/polyol phosphate export permease
MFLVYPDRVSWWLLLIPVIGVVQLLFSTGLAILVSGVNVFYRDVGNLSRHLMRFWFYLSPVLYGMDLVARITETHPTIGPLVTAWFRLNPMTYILTAYRDVIYDGQAPDWASLLVIAGVSLVILALSILFFKRVEPSFAKVL